MARGQRTRREVASRPGRVGVGPSAGDESPEARLGKRIKVQPDGCWVHTGAGEGQYAAISVGGRQTPAHRFVYETLVGPIPDDHILHHECETPECVNPEHLLPLTKAEHATRHAEMRRSA